MSDTVCPGCGVHLPKSEGHTLPGFYASVECLQMYAKIGYHTLTRRDNFFVHQVAGDSYAAQHIGAGSKPIMGAFALIGLYLLLEKKYTGRQVQVAHMRLAKTRKAWPRFTPPQTCGDVTAANVANAPDAEKDAMILAWAASVWNAWHDDHAAIAELAASEKAYG